ncbi:hypothetical protein JX266_014339 [Neoarthrinium moseri]|nr:hypothetical protein JX266_014339 [Neoarthrinium moseri]
MGAYISKRLRGARPFIGPAVEPANNRVPHTSVPIPPYFWGQEKAMNSVQARLVGYSEGRDLIQKGSVDDLNRLVTDAIKYLTMVYEEPQGTSVTDGYMVTLRISVELNQWRHEQQQAGRILPRKGHGLQRTTPEVIKLLRAQSWPEPLLTSNALFGSGWANLLIGAYDAPTLYSNYCLDMGFYYEHGYAKAFPQFEAVVRYASHDNRALRTPGGPERREATNIGLRYIQGKVRLETQHLAELTNKSARMDRRTAQVMCFAEGSLTGMACEAIVRGFDPAGVMADMVFSSPGTDVIDVGSDIGNSEVMNSRARGCSRNDGTSLHPE